MAKTDYRRELKHLYNPSSRQFSIVEVPEMAFLMVDGAGDPNTSAAFQEAMEALYGMAYTLKFALKAQGTDYGVMPSEGLWWAPDMSVFGQSDKATWLWTLMIVQPPEVTAELVEQARAEVRRKRNPAALSQVRLERYHEGLSVQILYVGAFADEGPVIAKMHAYAREQGYELAGKHHEIYLSDPRRTAPDEFKTVIRQPIRRADGA